jgi:hypothetical protein
MKKSLFVLALIVFATVLHAQIKLGLRAGVNFTNFSGYTNVKYESIAGPHAGVFVKLNIPFIKGLSLQPEVIYSSENAALNLGNDAKLMMTYLHFPLIFKYTSRFGIYGETGPQFEKNLTAKGKEGFVTVDETDEIKLNYWSWAVGIGYIHSSNFGIGARYNIGLDKLLEDEYVYTEKNVFQVSLIYMFRIK